MDMSQTKLPAWRTQMKRNVYLKPAIILAALLLTVTVVAVIWPGTTSPPPRTPSLTESSGKGSRVDNWCPLPKPVTPSGTLPSSSEFSGRGWVDKQVERLSAAVKVPTESYDDNGDVNNDHRWDVFNTFHRTLRDSFPLVHEVATLVHVNRYALVYTLKGSQESIRPLMLTAHQDVVPADSLDRWTYPPYDAHFDGTYLWGRGSSDCKNNLIGILSTVEYLLGKDWVPRRTIILAFGFDEETGGVQGAAKIAEYLETMWGRDGIELLLDEGGMGLSDFGDRVYARPAVAEKGYMDAILTVNTRGGHSSRPASPHSGIGIMAEIIVALEANPFLPQLTEQNPFRGLLECQARHSPEKLEPWLRKALEKDEHGVGQRLADARGGATRFSMQTSQAVDIIQGGNKVNALPESVEATVNYRIAPHDSLDIVKAHIKKQIMPIARKYNLAIVEFDGNKTGAEATKKSEGELILRSVNDLRPSPITPTISSSSHNTVWDIFAGTMRSVFEAAPTLNGKTVIPVGDIMLGNTDTIQYWNLTRNIFRWSPRRDGSSSGVHTIDEKIEMESHLEGMRFYYEILRNFDEYDG